VPTQREEEDQVRLMAQRSTFSTVPAGSQAWPTGEIVVAGAHGGAGTSTLAYWLHPAWNAGVVRHPARNGAAFSTGGRPLVLAARNTVPASGRATEAVNTLIWQGAPVDVLAVISDGLPEPAEASYRFGVLAGRVPVIVRVPFVASLRVAGSPAGVDLPRKAQRALDEIRAAVLGRSAAREFTTP
jgi:hypothetical protein